MRALGALRASGSEEEVLAAVRGVEEEARCCCCGGEGAGQGGSGGGEDVGDAALAILGASGFAAALRGDKGAEACEAALSAVAWLLLAAARAPWTAEEGPGIGDGAVGGGSLWALRDGSARGAVDAAAAQAVWAAAEPLVMPHLEAGRWSLRYHAARCVVTHDALLSLASAVPQPGGESPPVHQCPVRAKRLMRVARLSQDARAPLRGLALHAAAAALLLSPSLFSGDDDTAKHCMGAAVWMHAVQLVDDADGQVAHAARRLLSCSGYPAAGDSSASHRVADSAVCAAEPSAAAQCGALQCGAGSQGAAASFLGKVDARHVLSMLTRSLGLSSPWGRGAAAEDAHHVGDEGAGETREELAWLWREVERQDVSARLAGINAVLVLQRRHATAVQREWGVRQEMQLLIALQRAPGESSKSPRLGMRANTRPTALVTLVSWKWSVSGVLEVGSAGRHKLSGFLNQLATHCASVASPVPFARLSATSEAAADDGSLETAWEGRWSVGSLVQAYSELFPSTRAPGCDGWGDGWDTMTVTGEGDGDEDAYLVCARSYAQCLQHALQELARRRASTTDQQQGKEPWRSTLAMIAAAAVHRGTELVWAQRVELAASSGEATRVEAATGDAWGTVGLGGYQGYGASGSLLETERAAASLVLNASNAQLKRQALGAARVKAHLSLLCSLFGRPGTEASGVLQEDGADACGAGCMSGDLLARLLAALVQARNPWIWGVHKEVAEKADDLLQTLTAAYLARACPWASPLASAADADTASPQTSPSHSGGSSAPASISRGKAGRIKCEVVARVMWQQCREALEYEQPPNFLSDTTTTAIPTHVHSNSSSDSSRLKGGEGVATDLPAGACGCVWEWAAAVRGAAFLRASSMLWLAAHLGHAEAWSGNETGLWLGAALALLQQPTYDLKALGARLLVALLRQVRRSPHLVAP